MTDARHRWVFPEPDAGSIPSFRAAARDLGLGTFAATVLARRGIARPGGARRASWVRPRPASTIPRLLPDADRVLERVAAARERGERVMVFGDFDADGLTGLAQLVLAFRRLGIDAVPYVPSRLEEGHGLSMAAVDGGRGRRRRADRHGRHRVHERRRGRRGQRAAASTSIITDHHHLPEVLPAAVAIVNPHRADAALPGSRTCRGSGVAFTVARLLLGDAHRRGGGRAGPRRPRDDRDRLRRRRRSWARTAPSRSSAWSGCGRTPRPGIAALLARGGRGARPRRTSRPSGFVHRAAAQRRRTGGGGARRRPAPARRDAGARPPTLAATLEAANATRKDLMRDGDRRGAGRVRPAGPGAGARPAAAARTRRRPTRPAIRSAAGRTRPRCCSTGRGRSGSSGSSRAGSRTRPGGRPSWGRAARRRDPRLVPQRRPAGPGGRRSTACADLFVRLRRARGGGRVRAAGRPLGRVHRAVPGRGAAARPGGRAAAAPGGPRAPGAHTSTTACTATSPRLAPCGTGQPGTARRRPRAHRPTRPRRQRRPHAAGPAPRTRRHRRDRVRPT